MAAWHPCPLVVEEDHEILMLGRGIPTVLLAARVRRRREKMGTTVPPEVEDIVVVDVEEHRRWATGGEERGRRVHLAVATTAEVGVEDGLIRTMASTEQAVEESRFMKSTAQELYLSPAPSHTKRRFLLHENGSIVQSIQQIVDSARVFVINWLPNTKPVVATSLKVCERNLTRSLESWANLLLTQPPIEQGSLHLFDEWHSTQVYQTSVYCPNGGTLGVIFQAASQNFGQHPKCNDHRSFLAVAEFDHKGTFQPDRPEGKCLSDCVSWIQRRVNFEVSNGEQASVTAFSSGVSRDDDDVSA